MKDPKKYVRPCILALQPYSTARDDFSGEEQISVYIDANENPYPEHFSTAFSDFAINRYPDPHQRSLKTAISKLKGVSADKIFVGGAGSDEAIDIIYRIFCNPGIDNVVAIDPSYGVYSVSAAINDIEYRPVPLNEDFTLNTEALLDATDSKTKIIWICSPNNPTANAFDPAEIVDVCDRFDGIVVVDEAYIDFSKRGSMLNHVSKLRNLIVLQTFSKAWGMASLRLGMAFADPEVAELMARVKFPYNVNGPTQLEVERLITHNSPDKEIEEICNQRDKLSKNLTELKCVKHVYDSDANFLLVKFDDANSVYDYLLSKGILVRNRDKLTGCKGCLRITIGTPDENVKTINALRQLDK